MRFINRQLNLNHLPKLESTRSQVKIVFERRAVNLVSLPPTVAMKAVIIPLRHLHFYVSSEYSGF